MNTKTINSIDYNYIITSFLMFILMIPWFIWNRLPLLTISFYFIIILNFKNITFNYKVLPCTIILFFLTLWDLLLVQNNIIVILQSLLLFVFLNLRFDAYVSIFQAFKKMLAILLIPSIILYILVVFFNMSLSYSILPPLTSVKTYDYFNYFFFVDISHILSYSRFHAYFDEPGVLGTIGGMVLFADKYNLKNKYNVIIFIGCILTLSFYFFLLSLAFLALSSNNKQKYIFMFIILVLLLVLNRYEYFDEFFERFKLVNGTFAGDNRTDEYFDRWFDEFIYSSNIWFGVGSDYIYNMFPGGASFKYLIARNGLLFFLLYCLSFSICAFKIIKNKNNLLLWFFLFYSCMYQRPAINSYIYPIIWYISIYVFKGIDRYKINIRDNFLI